MFEDLFDFSDIEINESSSGLVTFKEYLNNKNEDQLPLSESFNKFNSIDESSEMITFLEYLESKNIKVIEEEVSEIIDETIEEEVSEIIDETIREEVSEIIDETIEEEVSEIIDETVKRVFSYESVETPKEIIKEVHESPKALWDGYVQMVTSNLRNRNIQPTPNIQDPQYLTESRIAYAEALIEEQRKMRDQIYFFTPGGRTVTVEDSGEEGIIGKAIIGKNKIN